MRDDSAFVMNSKLYDFLKMVSLVLLPGLAALYLALSQFWPLPAVEGVVGSVTAVDTFLGLLLSRASKNFGAVDPNIVGDLVVSQDIDGTVTGMRLVAEADPFVVKEGAVVSFRPRRDIPLS